MSRLLTVFEAPRIIVIEPSSEGLFYLIVVEMRLRNKDYGCT